MILCFVRPHLDPNFCKAHHYGRTLDKVRSFISKMPISSPNPMFYHLLELSNGDNSNKWSNIRFGEEITQAELIEVNNMQLIWSSDYGLQIS